MKNRIKENDRERMNKRLNEMEEGGWKWGEKKCKKGRNIIGEIIEFWREKEEIEIEIIKMKDNGIGSIDKIIGKKKRK